jgi:hypothetical protein
MLKRLRYGRDGRVAEGGGLLNRYTVKSRIGGSNPPLSASPHKTIAAVQFQERSEGVANEAEEKQIRATYAKE